jgi:broad specificity phosphatase PhoE
VSTLLVARHAQASFLADDYDRLSPLGERQARALGEEWARRGVRLAAVWIGPRQRHRQTWEGVAAAYRDGDLPCPQPVPLAILDEHHGQQVMTETLPRLAERDPSLRGLIDRHRAGEPEAGRDYLRLYHQVTRRWIRGELELPAGSEPWHHFRARVREAVRTITDAAGPGQTVAAFTSGGVAAAVLGLALDLDDDRVLELSWVVRNAACSEFLFSGSRFSLASFNVAPAVAGAEQSFI